METVKGDYFMRKKSHITLASYLLNSEGMEQLSTHKKAFYLGNLLPDCTPSFLTRRHNMEETFAILKKELKLLIERYDHTKGITAYFCRHLGIILHYVADYFTYPHNPFYPGNLKAHCQYEETLKHQIRTYVKSSDAVRERANNEQPKSVEQICAHIQAMHACYENSIHSALNDCTFITRVCHQITDFLLRFFDNSYADLANRTSNKKIMTPLEGGN